MPKVGGQFSGGRWVLRVRTQEWCPGVSTQGEGKYPGVSTQGEVSTQEEGKYPG